MSSFGYDGYEAKNKLTEARMKELRMSMNMRQKEGISITANHLSLSAVHKSEKAFKHGFLNPLKFGRKQCYVINGL